VYRIAQWDGSRGNLIDLIVNHGAEAFDAAYETALLWALEALGRLDSRFDLKALAQTSDPGPLSACTIDSLPDEGIFADRLQPGTKLKLNLLGV